MRLPRERLARPVTLVWLDTDGAILLRAGNPATGRPDAIEEECVRSAVPPHRRTTGHVHHDSRVRSGGGADPDDLAERRRERLLASYLREVAARVPPTDRVVILGSGPVHARFAAELRTADLRHQRVRTVEDEASGSLTNRQLRARLLELVGAAPERRLPANAVPR